jgi:2-iminobutanoate/2-iminopropanoate deaminase
MLLMAGCASSPAAVQTAAAPSAAVEFLTPYGPVTRPFSPAVRVGDLVFLAGQIGVDPDARGALVPGGIQPETRRTLENIRDVLQRIGLTMDHVAKCTVMMADMAEWDRMNEVYVTFFPRNKPARSAFGASGLALGARVEIECIASAR